jgi:hypothetical protein
MAAIALTHNVTDVQAAALAAKAAAAGVTTTVLLGKVLNDFTARAVEDFEEHLLERIRAAWPSTTAEQKAELIALLTEIEGGA